MRGLIFLDPLKGHITLTCRINWFMLYLPGILFINLFIAPVADFSILLMVLIFELAILMYTTDSFTKTFDYLTDAAGDHD